MAVSVSALYGDTIMDGKRCIHQFHELSMTNLFWHTDINVIVILHYRKYV
jgi:hypothetical protein